jgi:hypothetical protein
MEATPKCPKCGHYMDRRIYEEWFDGREGDTDTDSRYPADTEYTGPWTCYCGCKVWPSEQRRQEFERWVEHLRELARPA